MSVNTDNAEEDFTLVRFNANGSLDLKFGSQGKVTTDFYGGNDEICDIAIAHDGGIVAAGFAWIPSKAYYPNANFAFARYNGDGSLDRSFGSGGKVTTDFCVYRYRSKSALCKDGKIIAAGYDYSRPGYDYKDVFPPDAFVLARYNLDGTLDSTFGAGGRVTADLFGEDNGTCFAIQSDGKIVVAGSVDVGGLKRNTTDIELARSETNGNLDRTFGGGNVTMDFFGDTDDVNDIAIAPDGRIVAAGAASRNDAEPDFALVRYNSDGRLDATFGADPKKFLNRDNKTANCEPDGSAVLNRKKRRHGTSLQNSHFVVAGVPHNRIRTLHRDNSVTLPFAPNDESRSS